MTPTPEGKELGESEEPSSPRIMDSDYHSLSNAPVSPGRASLSNAPVSPGRASIYGKPNAFEARAGTNTKFSLDGLLSKYLNSLNISFCNKNTWFMLEIL